MKNLKLCFLTLVLMFLICGCGVQKLEKISLIVDDEIPINENRLVKISFEPSSIKEDFILTSSNNKVATVENKKIIAKSLGTVKITAKTKSGVSASKKIKVYIPMTGFNISDANLELNKGDEKQITVTFLPENATYKDVKWESQNSSVATVDEAGIIKAKSAGETLIVATSKEGLKKECKVIVKEQPIEFSGTGDRIISDIYIPHGNYKAILSNEGDSNFIVKFYEDANDSYGSLLVNEIGAYNGSVVLKDGSQSPIISGMLEIESNGNWIIRFEKISENIESNSVSGSKDTVTGWFMGNGKRMTASFNNTGSSNFIVKVYNDFGEYDLLANEIGPYSGQTTFKTTTYNKYYYEVISDGSWSISWK